MLLHGLFMTGDTEGGEQQGKPTSTLPAIAVRPIKEETLFPVFDGSCSAMIHRRSVIHPPTLVAERITDYAAFDQRMRTLLGFPAHEEKINWLNVKEILTCHEVHNISWVEGVTAQDVDKVTEITGWSWGVLYKDDILNKLAIGRFLHEMSEDISQLLVNPVRKFIAYSGHDSTLVPVLCALGIYE
eukprot:gene27951-36828_t